MRDDVHDAQHCAQSNRTIRRVSMPGVATIPWRRPQAIAAWSFVRKVGDHFRSCSLFSRRHEGTAPGHPENTFCWMLEIRAGGQRFMLCEHSPLREASNHLPT